MPRSRAKRDRKLEKYGRCAACGWLVPQLRMAEHVKRYCFRQAKPEPVIRLVETQARELKRPGRHKQSKKRSTSRLPKVPEKGVVPIRRDGQRFPEDVSIIMAGPDNIKFLDSTGAVRAMRRKLFQVAMLSADGLTFRARKGTKKSRSVQIIPSPIGGQPGYRRKRRPH